MESDSNYYYSVCRQDHKEEAVPEPELSDVRERGMLIAGVGAFQVEEIAKEKTNEQIK